MTFSPIERKVLLALHKLGRAKRIRIQQEVDGHTGGSALVFIRAVRGLQDAGFVESAYHAPTGSFDRKWQLTEAGRLHVEAARAFDTDPKGAA